MELTHNARVVLEKRYLRKDEDGVVVESPEDMLQRVARHVAMAEKEEEREGWAEKFYGMMERLDFLPNSPTLMNAGMPLGMLSACFLIEVDDSMDSIFQAVKNMALVQRSGGGTGFNFSRLRAEGSPVRSTQGLASGPLSFIKVFNQATEVIKQGGKRRGASMASLSVNHPDILAFIAAKDVEGEYANFNFSVLLTDEFMQAASEKRVIELRDPHSGDVVNHINAWQLLTHIAAHAWLLGEPGVQFIDAMERGNPTPWLGKIDGTNPCSEAELRNYESCNLASINLAHYVKDGEVDYARLGTTVANAVRFLDDVISVNKYPLPEIERETKLTRKIGLGVMGWADMLIQLGIPYDSDQAVDLAEYVMEFVALASYKASLWLAKERGPYPAWDPQARLVLDWHGANSPLKDQWRMIERDIATYGTRNAAVNAIAPTGTLSMIAGCSSGIEPIFAVAYTKTVLDGTPFVEVNPYFREWAESGEIKLSAPDYSLICEDGTLHGLKYVPDDVKELYKTAGEIGWRRHVEMQAAFQKWTDLGISKTICLPNAATVEDVEAAYRLAWQMGCKGLTVYRDGSREKQVLVKGAFVKQGDKWVSGDKVEAQPVATPRNRPAVVSGTTRRIRTGCGNLFVTINEDDDGLLEVFVTLGKSGGCFTAQTEALGRLISTALRSGVSADVIAGQLTGIRCSRPTITKEGKILSCADAIAKALHERVNVRLGEEITINLPETCLAADHPHDCPDCPECGMGLVFEEGCVHCQACGFSQC